MRKARGVSAGRLELTGGTWYAHRMSEPENITLVYLRRIDEKLDRVIADVADMKLRVGHLETSMAQVQVRLAEMSVRMDKIETRLDRIERRLDLISAD